MNRNSVRPMKELMKRSSVFLSVAVLSILIGCSRDPNTRKQKFFASGTSYLQQGKYEEATISFISAIRIDPRFAEAHYQLGQTYLKLGIWKNAYVELKTTVELQPDNVAAHLDLGNLLFASRNIDQANEQVKVALQKAPSDVGALALSAKILAAQHDYDSALQTIQKAIAIDPRRAQLYTDLASIQVNAGEFAAAETSLRKTIELEPSSAMGYVNLGSLYQKQHDAVSAEGQFQQAIKIEPKSIPARIALSRFYLANSQRDKAESVVLDGKQALGDTPSSYRLAADFYLGIGEKQKALTQYEMLCQRFPKDLEAKRSYIELLLERNQVEQAKRLNDEILKLNSKDPFSNTIAADIELRSGKTSDAIALLQPLLKSDPDNSRAHYLLGIAFDHSGDSAQAEKEWRDAARLRPDMVAAYDALAKLALRTGNLELLTDSAEQLVKLQPSSPEGYLFRANAERARHESDKAEADIATAVHLAPESSSAYLSLAKLRLSQRRFGDAASNFQLALDRDPDSTEATAGLAQSWLAQKQPAKAIAVVGAQIAKRPNNSGFYYTLGALQLGTHDLTSASNSFKKAIELNSGNFPALFQLGQLELAQGDSNQAAQQWSAWMAQDPRNPNPAWLLGRLEDSRNNWQKAQDYYQKALQAKPDFPPAANDLAYSLLIHDGNPDVALSLAQAARRGLPDSPNSADTLALAYMHKKVYATAIDLLQDAIRKSPANAVFEYHLGLAYQQTGNAVEAKKHLSRALAVDPKFAQAADASKALHDLGI